jgi:hypothetical protein
MIFLPVLKTDIQCGDLRLQRGEGVRELKTPVQLGENFYGPRAVFEAIQARAGDYVIPDLPLAPIYLACSPNGSRRGPSFAT